MGSSHQVSGLLVASVLGLSLVAGVGVGAPISENEAWQNETTPVGPERAFIADDPDPLSGSLPPFVLGELTDVVQSENASVANVSRIRDFTYSTTEPDVAVGADDQTLQEYRRSQLTQIERNNSSSRWLPRSNRSNGTVVKNAHITFLGTLEGTQARVGAQNRTAGVNASAAYQSQRLIPRNGSVMSFLGYQTMTPTRRCSIQNGTALNGSVERTNSNLTAAGQVSVSVQNSSAGSSMRVRTCRNYTIQSQRVSRSLQIGNQTWMDKDGTPRVLSYSSVHAEGLTSLVLEATINTTVTQRTTTAVRAANGSWTQVNASTDEITLSHTVRDRARVVVTTNQELTATQTLVVDENGELEKIVLRTSGPATVSERRLWSYARFEGGAGRVRNVWGVYSQRRTPDTGAVRGAVDTPRFDRNAHGRTSEVVRGGVQSNKSRENGTTVSPQVRDQRTADKNSVLMHSQRVPVTEVRQDNVSFPDVLELQLVATQARPTIQWGSQEALSAPQIARVQTQNLSGSAAPTRAQVNVTSVQPRVPRTIVVKNVDRPLSKLVDIHGDAIPMETRSVREHSAVLQATVLNETHARLRLVDGESGAALSGRTLWLRGASQGRVQTNENGVAVVERRDLFVTASFTGATNVSREVFYGPTETRIEFSQKPFNVYQFVGSLAGAFVSVAGLVVLFLPVVYLQR